MFRDELQAILKTFDESLSSRLELRYLGIPAIAVRGTITRNLYHFSENEPEQMVDKRDAKYLLATPLFGIAQ